MVLHDSYSKQNQVYNYVVHKQSFRLGTKVVAQLPKVVKPGYQSEAILKDEERFPDHPVHPTSPFLCLTSLTSRFNVWRVNEK